MEELLAITSNYRIFCKIFANMKWTDVLYFLLLYFVKFQKDILKKKCYFKEFSQVMVW